MNDGISQLEKLANVQREKKINNKKKQEMHLIKENKKRENNKREEEAKKDERRGGGGSKVLENVTSFTQEQKKEMEDIVRQRNEVRNFSLLWTILFLLLTDL